MRLTEQQADFVSEIRAGDSNVALMAVAGSGKTTTLVEAAKYVQASGIACAFNKAIQQTLADRMPANFSARTMNSLGLRAWQSNLGSRRAQTDGRKLDRIIKELWPNWEDRNKTPGLKRFVELMKLNEVVPEGQMVPAKRNSEGFLINLMGDYEIESEGREQDRLYIERGLEVLVKSIRGAWMGDVDFADQLYMPVAFGAKFERFPFVMVDETQDLNPIQHRIIERIAAERLVVVGDPAQSIYGFAGATRGSMDLFIDKFQMKKLPLTYSFRCPKAVVAEARRYNDQIQAAPDNIEGIVERGNLSLVSPGDTIISYRNSSIVEAALICIARNMGVQIVKGANLAKQLQTLAMKFSFPRDRFIEELKAWGEEKRKEYLSAEQHGKADRISDTVRALTMIVLKQEPRDGYELQSIIEHIFDETHNAQVKAMTIHSAKGLEFNSVHFYRKGDLFTKWSKRTEGDKEQRRNMAYVAITRAMTALTFSDPDQRDREEVEED